MPRTALAAALSCALALSACVSTTAPPTVTAASTALRVQAYAVRLCGYEPAIGFVARLLTSSSWVDEAADIAAAICAVVVQPQPASLGRHPAPPARPRTVRGVPVEGRFVVRP